MEVKFARSAITFLNTQSAPIVSKLIDDCADLAADPHLAPDEPRKTLFYAPPVFFHIYQDESHWIIYEIKEDEEHILIVNIGPNSEEPRLRRPA